MERIKGGVCAPEGFKAAGAECELKYKDRPDMAMIVSDTPCRAGGVFTKNVVKAAPVLWDKERIAEGKGIRAIVVNSGIANACTGDEGMTACEETAKKAAEALGIAKEEVLVSSTGVIGMQLPLDKVKAGIDRLVPLLGSKEEDANAAARAIITTDTHEKEIALRFDACGVSCAMGAMAKGSGMIHPNMGTMLCFVTCDINISGELLKEAVRTVVTDTFNMVSVDGDTSTNDSLIVLANGAAKNPEIVEKGRDYEAFLEALNLICTEMAKALAGDGEGATALFEAKVINADTKENARKLAKSVICSTLTKAAIFGHDANWGRILCALGYSGADFDPAKISLHMESEGNRILIYENGKAADYSEEEATRILSAPEVTVLADMKSGDAEACAWGCDLSYDYVKINADYRS